MFCNEKEVKKEHPVRTLFHALFAGGSFLDYANIILLVMVIIGLLFLGLFTRTNESYLSCKLVTEEKVLQSGSEAADISLYARGAVLMDADSGRVLYEKNGYEAMPMASTTKIMTCILALENCELDETVYISKEAASQPAVKANLRQGEAYRLGDLLLIMMLESYNDAAYAIAEHTGGNIETFRDMMNEKAKLLGMEHSYFITPNGLDAEDVEGVHSSAAYDMALLGRYAIKNEVFRDIISKRNVVISDLEGKRSISAVNRDAFLDQMEGSLGIKTGFTNGAGYCFVGALEQNEKTLISVVLGSGWPPSKRYKWKDTRQLMEFGLGNYEYKEFEYQLKPQCCIVKNSSSKNKDYIIAGLSDKEKSNRYLVSENDNVIEKCIYVSNAEGDINAGQILGYRMLYLNGELVEKNIMRAEIDMKQTSILDAKEFIFYRFFLSPF